MGERNYREKAIEEYGEECQACGAREDIIVHHKDGSQANDELSNLIPLCTTCHGKVHGRSNEVPGLVKELGHRPRSPSRTTVQVSDTLMDVLHERRGRSETYEDVIWSLIGEVEQQ